MEFISECSAAAINKAAEALIAGNLVAFPTETVYGLGADATSEEAVSKIYKAKGRPADHPLIVHVSSLNSISDWAVDIPEYAIQLARDFWPGPMTLVLKRSGLAKDFVTGGQGTVGLRVPNHPLALSLLQSFEKLGGKGLAAPSANRFGAVSPTDAGAVKEELESYLNSEDLILDGGSCSVGVESTIIDCTGKAPKILRLGAITSEMIESSTGIELFENSSEVKIRVSGSLQSHYAPKAKVLLNADPKPGDFLIALAQYPAPANVNRLIEPRDVEEYARQLYFALRLADIKRLASVVAIEPRGGGLAAAIRDRLSKAASGK